MGFRGRKAWVSKWNISENLIIKYKPDLRYMQASY